MEPVYDHLPPLSEKYTWLVAQNPEVEDGIEDQIFYTIDNKIHYRCRVPELLGRRIRGYFHGWVILSNNVAWSLWNPVTSKIIHLPPLILRDKDYASIGQCCLSSPPDDPGSILLFTRTTKPTFVFCRLNMSYGNKLRWIEKSYGRKLKKITDSDYLLHCPTVFNGKVYALNTGKYEYVIQVDIVAKPYGEEIELLLFGAAPCPEFSRRGFNTLLKGSGTELFYIFVDFSDDAKKTLGDVYLFKWVMTSTEWKELKDIDRRSCNMERIMWKEIVDLKDAVFFVDLACHTSVSYRHAIASELGGYIHIRDDTGKMIYSYHVEDRTIFPSYMSFQATHLTLWESSFEVDCGEAKCPRDFKQETNKDDKIMIRSVTDGVDESRSNYLPFHILEMIMERCVGVEYMHFRATCKHFRLTAPLIRWSNKTAMRRLQTYSVISPWLMVVDKNRGIVTFTDPILGDKYLMKRSQIMSILHEKIFCSRFGWLVYKMANLSLVFFNPFTSEIHNLPCQIHNHSRSLPHLSNVCLSAPPSSLKCTVVGFSLGHEPRVYLHLVAGERKWQMFPLDYGGVDPHSMCFPTFVGRDIYALFNNGDLYVLKNVVRGQDYNYSWKKVVDAEGRSGQHFLVKSDQHLLLVVVSNKFGESVDVYKLNKCGKEWEKFDCLGRYMIYICSSTCVCIEAKIPEMENKIYFPRFDSKNGDIVFYSLDTRKYHTFKDKLIRENLGMGLEHVNTHAWIEPSWSLIAN